MASWKLTPLGQASWKLTPLGMIYRKRNPPKLLLYNWRTNFLSHEYSTVPEGAVIWRIDQQIDNSHSANSGILCGYCSPAVGSQRSTYFAKWLPENSSVAFDEADLRFRYPSQAEAWLYFQRQAIVASQLDLLTDSQIDSPRPLLVFPRWSGLRLDDWLETRSQLLTQSSWVAISLELLQQLQQLHATGYVHGQLCSQHIWLTAAEQVRLLGLGRCEPVGVAAEYRRCATRPPLRGTAYLAPELYRTANDFTGSDSSLAEVSSAEDIFAAATVLNELSDGHFTKTPIGRCMQAENPYDRPTAGELVELFASFQRELFGSAGFASPRAA